MTKTIRKQSMIVQSGLRQKVIWIFLIISLFIIAGIGYLISQKGIYVPPKFERNASLGIPQPDEHFMYGTLDTDYGFKFSMATNLYQQEDKTVYVYFTNYEENNVNMMCEIINKENGEVYYRSGVITPGQYMERLAPALEFPNEAFEALIMIYTFEEGTWYSGGTVEIAATVQAW